MGLYEPLGGVESKLTVRRSRFLGVLRRVKTADHAKAIVEQLRSKYAGARHVAFAYAVGTEHAVVHGQSDDGEPHGTAGRPILDQIGGGSLSNCLVVVVRYFGGVKLGTGGLARAYGEVARAAIQQAVVRPLVRRCGFTVSLAYEHADAVERCIEECAGAISERTYATRITVHGSVPATEEERFVSLVRDATSGASYPEIDESNSP